MTALYHLFLIHLPKRNQFCSIIIMISTSDETIRVEDGHGVSYASKSFYISISTIVFHITLSPNISPLYFLSINMHIFYPTNSIAVPFPISKFCLFFKNHSHVSSFEHSFIMFISRSISRLLRSSSHWEFFFHA